MARKLTREQFQSEFGVSVDDMLKRTRVQEQPKSIYDNPNVVNAARAQVEHTQREPIPTANEERFGQSLMPRPLDRAQQNVVAGVLALPAGPMAAVGLLRTAPAAVYDYFMSDDADASFEDALAEQIFDPQALENINKEADQAAKAFLAANPDATAEELQKFGTEFTQSPEFYDKVTSLMPADLRTARNIQDFANNAVGLNARSDQMSAGDEATQIAAGAFIGLPSKVAASLSQRVSAVVGERFAQHTATRATARTLEALTPLTLPLTPGNIALNAGVGVSLNEGIRSLQGEDTLLDYEQIFENAQQHPTMTGAAAAGLAMAVPVAASRVAQKIGQQAATNGLDVLARKSGGPSLANQDPTRMQPTISPTTGMVDEISQLTHAAQTAGAKADDLDDLEIAIVSGGYNSRKEIENRIYNYGELDGTHKTIPLADIDRGIQSLSPEAQSQFQDYMMAISRKQDTDLQLNMYQRQLGDALNDVHTARLSNNKQQLLAATDRVNEIKKSLGDIATDTVDSRPSKVQWARSDVDNAIKQGNSIPEFVKMRDVITKYSDDLLRYSMRMGRLTQEEFDELRVGRPLYFPLSQREFPDATGLKRKALLFGKRLQNEFRARERPDNAPDVLQRSGRDLTVRGVGKVNAEADVLSSLRQMTADVVQQVQTNNARKNVIDIIRTLPGSNDMMRTKNFKSRRSGQTVNSLTPAQYARWRANSRDSTDYIMVHDNTGRIQLVKFADQGIQQMMKLHPNTSIPILNSMRKMYQHGMTGLLRPAFAATNFFREAGLTMTTRPSGRTVGLVDTFLHRLGEGTVLDTIGQNIPDPTIMLNSAAQIPHQLWQRSLKAMSQKIKTDLTTSSGVFNALLQDPASRKYVENIANKIALSLDQTAYGLMTKRMSASFGHMNDISDVLDDFTKGAQRNSGVMRTALDTYKALLESVQMANRVAFWSTNLGNLSHKYGGVSKIPERELKKLELDTRNLGGDMSRRSKSDGMQRAASVIPYANTIMQGTRHFLASSVPHVVRKQSNKHLGTNFLLNQKNNFWPIFTSGVVVPKLMSMAVIAEWEGAEEWWYQRTPAWQRMVTMPIPRVEAIQHRIKTGSWPQGDPGNHFYKIPLPPEFALFLNPIEAGIRAAGIVPSKNNTAPGFIQAMGQSLSELVSVPMPPVVGIPMAHMGLRGDINEMVAGQAPHERTAAPLSGAHYDKVSPGNSMSTWLYDMIGAIVGTGGQNVADALNVGELAATDGQQISEMLSKTFSTYVQNERQGLPEVGVPYIWNSNERKYTNTPDSEYVFNTIDKLEPMFKQLERERDSSKRAAIGLVMGGNVAPAMQDKRLLAVSDLVYGTIRKKGDFKEADDRYRDLKLTLQHLPRAKLSATEFQRKKNEIIKQQQLVRSMQAKILRDMESALGAKLNDTFKKLYGVPFTYENLSELVKKDTAR